jgi:hypothetical protein
LGSMDFFNISMKFLIDSIDSIMPYIGISGLWLG